MGTEPPLSEAVMLKLLEAKMLTDYYRHNQKKLAMVLLFVLGVVAMISGVVTLIFT